MVKVIQFIHGLNMGGAETLVKDYAINFNKKDIDLTVLCLERRDSPYEEILKMAKIKVIYICDEIPLWGRKDIFSRLLNHFILYLLVRKYIRKIAPDILHYHLILGSYVRFAKPDKSTVIFYTQHFQVERWKRDYLKDIEAVKWLMKNYKMKLIALNNSMKEELNELFKVDDTLVLNNGIDISSFNNSIQFLEGRKSLGISEGAFVIGHVGRFVAIKNHSFLIDVFAEIEKKNKNAFLLMIGNGEKIQFVRNKLSKLGLENKYLILSERTDISDLMRMMDVFVFPSFSEGMPVTLVEAQISGLKCIVSDVIPEAIRISNLVKYASLKSSAKIWAEEILSWEVERIEYYDLEKWDICKIVDDLENLYYQNTLMLKW